MNASGTDSQFWDVQNVSFNLSAFDEEPWPKASEVKLCAILMSMAVSLVCNGTMVFVLVRSSLRRQKGQIRDWRMASRVAVVDIMVVSVGISALARDISGHTVQIVKVVDDGYELGVISCRLQAFANHVFRYLFHMYLALLYVERYVRHWRSEEHSMSFPALTIKIFFCGLFLVVTSQMTGPLYGWGNYDYVPETWSCGLDLLSPSSCSFVVVVNSFLFIPAWLTMTVTNLAFFSGQPKECMDKRERSRCTSAVLQDEKIKFLLCCNWIGVSVLSWPIALLEIMVSCRTVRFPNPDLYFWAHLAETETSFVFPLAVLMCSAFNSPDIKKTWRQSPD